MGRSLITRQPLNLRVDLGGNLLDGGVKWRTFDHGY